MKRLYRFLIAVILVGGCSMYLNECANEGRAQGGQVVIDPAVLSQEIVSLLEELIRSGDYLDGLSDAAINMDTFKELKNILQNFEDILSFMGLASMSVTNVIAIKELAEMFANDLEFFRSMERYYKSENMFSAVVSNIHMVTSYVHIGNIVLQSLSSTIKQVMNLKGKDVSPFEFMQFVTNTINQAYSSYFAIRTTYMNRYFYLNRHFSRYMITLGNEDFVTILL